MAQFHHFSMCSQNQSMSILSFLGKIPRLKPYFLARHGSFSSLINVQSKSINVNFGHFSAKYQGYSLTLWSNMAHFHHFSMRSQNQSMSIVVISHQATKVIALLFGQKCLIVITFIASTMCSQHQSMPQFWSSLFNVQSTSINVNFGHFSA